MKIIVKGMLGAGNLGDDLISYFLIKNVKKHYPNASLFVYSGKQKNPFVNTDSLSNIQVINNSTNRPTLNYLKLKVKGKVLKNRVDKVVIGGGGLVQDVHRISTINKWLNTISSKTDNYLVGIGFGPIYNDINNSFLIRILKYFSIQVRDEESREIVKSLGYSSQVSTDIVAGSDITCLFKKSNDHLSEMTLGIAVRPWKNLKDEELKKIIKFALTTKAIEKVVLFTFEYSEENTTEFNFNVKLKKWLQSMNIQTSHYTYNKDEWEVFKKAFEEVDYGIASRLHANILWQKLNIPIIPISYDDKVNSYYRDEVINDIRLNRYSERKFIKQNMQQVYTLPDLTKKTKKPNKAESLYLWRQNLKFYLFDVYNSIKIRVKK